GSEGDALDAVTERLAERRGAVDEREEEPREAERNEHPLPHALVDAGRTVEDGVAVEGERAAVEDRVDARVRAHVRAVRRDVEAVDEEGSPDEDDDAEPVEHR